MMPLNKISYRVLCFLGIGCLAALTHVFVVFSCVSYSQINPLISNVIAFLVAFNVSFIGHKYYTFSNLPDEKQLSLAYFFGVAASAAVINELLYFVLLRYTHLHYLVSLVLVLGSVALYTFFCSRYWACRS